MDADFLLIRKMKTGDKDAIEAFIRKYYPAIFNYCRYHTWDTATAEDLTQETFMKFCQLFSTYQHEGKLANYLYVIAGNLCKDKYKRKTDMSFEAIEEETFQELVSEDDTEVIIERMEVEQAVRKLPDELREVVTLHYFQGLKQKEIASICHIGLPLVKYRLKQAKENLKVLLGEEETHESGKKVRKSIRRKTHGIRKVECRSTEGIFDQRDRGKMHCSSRCR